MRAVDFFSIRQIVLFVIALVAAGALVSAATVYVLEKVVIVGNPDDPITKRGGLSVNQDIRKK
jgi:hypothetical protein